MKPKPEKGLTAKEEAFCYEYIKDLCAAHAADRAGYSENSKVRACCLLRKPAIKKLIDELQKERQEKCKMTADQVLEEVRKLARSDINDYASIQDFVRTEWQGKGKKKKAVKVIIQDVVFRPWMKLDTRPIESVKKTENGISIKMHDKMKALDFLGRYFKLIGVDLEQGEKALNFISNMMNFSESPESKLNQPGPPPAPITQNGPAAAQG